MLTPKTQTQGKQKRKYNRNFTKLRRTQGCLTDCVAYFLNLHPENVPYFVYPRKGWNERLKAFFKKHGYMVYWDFCKKIPKKGTHIVSGHSKKWKTYAHVVVYRNGKLVYDPNYPSTWEEWQLTHRLLIKKYK